MKKIETYLELQGHIYPGDICDIIYENVGDSRPERKNVEFIGYEYCKYALDDCERYNNRKPRECIGCLGEMQFRDGFEVFSDCFSYMGGTPIRITKDNTEKQKINLPDELFEI